MNKNIILSMLILASCTPASEITDSTNNTAEAGVTWWYVQNHDINYIAYNLTDPKTPYRIGSYEQFVGDKFASLSDDGNTTNTYKIHKPSASSPDTDSWYQYELQDNGSVKRTSEHGYVDTWTKAATDSVPPGYDADELDEFTNDYITTPEWLRGYWNAVTETSDTSIQIGPLDDGIETDFPSTFQGSFQELKTKPVKNNKLVVEKNKLTFTGSMMLFPVDFTATNEQHVNILSGVEDPYYFEIQPKVETDEVVVYFTAYRKSGTEVTGGTMTFTKDDTDTVKNVIRNKDVPKIPVEQQTLTRISSRKTDSY